MDEFWVNPQAFVGKSVEEIRSYLKDENRSSTIFPVLSSERGKSILSFLNYWGLKHGNFVILLMTFRNEDGSVRALEWKPIIDVKSYSFDLGKYFQQVKDKLFCGTVEVEFFSKDPPRFTFPGVSIIYEGSESSSVVHSCIRKYNIDEEIKDYALDLPQTGFDVVMNQNNRNYVCFAGGRMPNYNFKLTLENGARTSEVAFLIENKNNQMHVLDIESYFPDVAFEGICKLSIEHDLDVFPRFYCGTYRSNDIPTITHSFFDTSSFLDAKEDSEKYEYSSVREIDEDHYDSAMMFPIIEDDVRTQLISYGQSMGFEGTFDFRFFDKQGTELTRFTGDSRLGKDWSEWRTFDPIQKILNEGLEQKPSAALIGFRTHNGRFPARYKLGLNIFKKDHIGTNICVGPTTQDGSLFQKPFSRRWFALGGKSNFIATLHNTSFKISTEDQKANKLDIQVYNQFGEICERSFTINKNGSVFMDVNEDKELGKFLAGEIGWCLAQADTCLLDGFFISTKGKIMGGDHVF